MTLLPWAVGLVLIAQQALTLTWMKGGSAIPVAAGVLALAGLLSPVGVNLSRTRRLEGLLVLALVFAVRWRVAPPNDMAIVFNNGIGLALAQFLLVLQGVLFWVRKAEAGPEESLIVRRRDRLPASLPLLGAAVMALAGDAAISVSKGNLYQGCALAYTVLAAVFYGISDIGVPRLRMKPLTASFVVLALAVGVSWATDRAVVEYRSQIDKIDVFLARGLNGFSPFESVGYSGRGELGSVAYSKTQAEGKVALRVFSESEPGYLRGRVFVKYADSRWEPELAEQQAPFAEAAGLKIPADMQEPQVFALGGRSGKGARAFDVWPVVVYPVAFTPLGTQCLATETPSLTVNPHGGAEAQGLLRYVAFASAADQAVTEPAPQAELTALPHPLDPRVEQLAKTVMAGCTTSAEKIAAVQSYFRRTYKYNLGIKVPAGQDPLTYFLVEKPAAHCEYFATGAAVLLRLGGVPCLYVTGFVAGERNSVGGYWTAKNRDAHAWVEAFDEKRGWVIVEATPDAGVPRADEDKKAESAWGDYLRFQVHRALVLGIRNSLKAIGAWVGRGLARVAVWLVSGPGGVGVIVFLVVALAVWVARRGRKARPKPTGPDPAFRELQRRLAAVDKMLLGKGLSREPHETLSQFASRLSKAGEQDPFLRRAADWYRGYVRIRYGVPVDRVRDELAQLQLPG